MDNGKENFGVDNLKCPSCNVTSPSETWLPCLVPCDDCGDHTGVSCPACDEEYDHVFGYDKIEKENNLS